MSPVSFNREQRQTIALLRLTNRGSLFDENDILTHCLAGQDDGSYDEEDSDGGDDKEGKVSRPNSPVSQKWSLHVDLQ